MKLSPPSKLPLMLLALACVDEVSATMYSRAPWVVWSETRARVDQGLLLISAKYKQVSVCKPILSMFDESNQESNRALAFKRLHERCEETYYATWNSTWEYIAGVAQSQSNHTIVKRFVDPISLGCLVVSGCVAAGLYFGHPDSPYYRIPQLQKQLNGLENEVKLLQNYSAAQQETSKTLEKVTKAIFQDITDLKTEDTTTNLNAADLAWTASVYHTQIVSERDDIMDVVTAFERGDHVPLKSMAKLLRMPGLRKYRDEHTRFIHLYRTQDNVIEFTFSIKTYDPHTIVLRANPFPLITNITKNKAVLEYSGPKFAIHNHTSNCTTGSDEPNEGFVTDECTSINHFDAKLMSWTQSNKTANPNFKPIVKKLGDASNVFCPFQNITIDNATYPCPAYPLSLPLTVGFQVVGISHKVSHRDIQASEEMKAYSFRVLNQSLAINSRIPSHGELLEELHEANEKQGELVSHMNTHFSIPLTGSTPWLMGFGTIGQWILSTFLIAMICNHYRGGNSGAPQVTVNTTTNVVNGSKKPKHTVAHDPKTCIKCVRKLDQIA